MTAYILQIRTIILIASKLITLGFCIFYIIQYNDYFISWNTNAWIIGPIIAYFHKILNSIGSLILLLPITVIVTSFLYEKSIFINASSGLLGVGGGLFAIIRGFSTGTLQEYYNMKLFVVYHAITLDTKRDLFITEYQDCLNKYKTATFERFAFLEEHLNIQYFDKYDTVLARIPATEIKLYAKRVLSELNVEWENGIKPSLSTK